jgi:DNA-binding GntR family transcriptional regulator
MPKDESASLAIRRETLVDKLLLLLQESILSGKRLPKSKISEVGIAKEFGVSRVPAREALQRLEEMNLVRKTHLGREIMQFSREEFEQIYELKNVVEAFGAMKGCLNAKQQDMKRIEAILKKMEKTLAREDVDQLMGLNHLFHDALVFCCDNPQVIDTFSSLVRKIRWVMPFSLRLPTRPEQSYREHREIFAAFRKREAEKLRQLLERHSNNNMHRIVAKMAAKD